MRRLVVQVTEIAAALVVGLLAMCLLIITVQVAITWPWTLVPMMAPVAIVARTMVRWWLRYQGAQSEIADRADYEHNALMSGDMRVGIFGQFPPAVES